MKIGNSGEGTGSLEKALDVLDAVGQASAGLSQGEISEQLDLPRTTVYRLLATLVTRGFLRRDPIRKVYCIGFRCFEMAKQAHAMPDLAAAAATELRTLRDLTGETSYLATLEGAEVISLERYDGAHSQRSSASLGQRKPLYCTSQGKAILSVMPSEERDVLIRDITLKPLTPHTHTDRRRLHADLKIIAARGWSMDDEEIVLGVRCVGAPIVDAEGQVRGAISVAGPAWRITRERAELLGPEVAEAARRIGAQLGKISSVVGDPQIMAIDGPWAFQGGLPRWCPTSGRLYWADLLAPALRCFDGAQDRLVLDVEAPIIGLAFQGSDLVLAHESAVLRITSEGLIGAITPWPDTALQALCNAPDGGLWAAMAAPGGSVVGQVLSGGQFYPHWNIDEPVQALCWDPAGKNLYVTAPGSGSLLMLRTGSGNVRRLASLPKGSGRVSGLAVDAQGGAWTALRDGWSVVRMASDGSLDRVIGLPVPCPTDVTVVNEHIYITTARQPVPLDALEKAPLSGRLLSVKI